MTTPISPGGFGTPTDSDSRPWLWVASILACAYSVLTLAARIMSKIEMLSWEDGILGLAYVWMRLDQVVLGLIHWGLFDRATYIGFGAQGVITGAESQLRRSSQVLLLCAIYLSKISVLWFARRLFSLAKKRRERKFDIAIGITAICGIASVVLVSARCDFRHALEAPQRCANLRTRWIVIQVLDTLTELAVVALPTCYIWQNSLVLSSKLSVIFLFALRLPCIIFFALATTEYRRNAAAAATDNSAYDVAAVWSEVVLGYSLSSASLPCIRTFLMAFLADSIYHVPVSTLRSHGHRSRSGASATKTGMLQNVSAAEAGELIPDEHSPLETASTGSNASRRVVAGQGEEIEVLRNNVPHNGSVSRRDPQHDRRDPFDRARA